MIQKKKAVEDNMSIAGKVFAAIGMATVGLSAFGLIKKPSSVIARRTMSKAFSSFMRSCERKAYVQMFVSTKTTAYLPFCVILSGQLLAGRKCLGKGTKESNGLLRPFAAFCLMYELRQMLAYQLIQTGSVLCRIQTRLLDRLFRNGKCHIHFLMLLMC